ncbi:MAG: nodulation protein NfeD [Bryobacteraceae bacterium]|nr:nodulation protein NfeD [Bryobacteraceae bacterium]
MSHCVLGLLALSLASLQSQAQCLLRVDIDGVIHPVTVEILERAAFQAKQQNCSLLLVRLNTPGGFADATRRAVEVLISSEPPVVAYVAPSGGRAASAGFWLLEAADVAAMAPGTNTGAATPVLLAGQPDEVMKRKIENDAAASIRSLADRRGRNSAEAEKTVRESKSFTDREALERNLIDLVATNETELLRLLDGREVRRFDGRRQKLASSPARIIVYERSLKQKVQESLSDPNLALAILVLGLMGLYIEFTAPGVVLPGVLGGILTLLGLSALSVMPVSWAGAGLILLAIALFALETQVPSHGVLGTGGAVAMVLGSILLVDSPLPELRIRLSTALALSLPFALITLFLVTIVVKARRRKAATGVEGMTGLSGISLTDVGAAGQVLVHGEIWQARSDSPIPSGAPIRVSSIHGLELTVRPDSGPDAGENPT